MLIISCLSYSNYFRQNMTVIKSHCNCPLTLMTSLTVAVTMVTVTRGIQSVTMVMATTRGYH